MSRKRACRVESRIVNGATERLLRLYSRGAGRCRPDGDLGVFTAILTPFSTTQQFQQRTTKVRPRHQVQHDIARVVRQTYLLDHLAAEYVALVARPRRVLGNVKVTECVVTFRELSLEDVYERGGESRGDHVERHGQQHDGRRHHRRS